MAMPNNPKLRARASLEDMQALMCAITTCQRTMLVLGLRGRGQEALDSVWTQAGKQARYLDRLHHVMESSWYELQALLDADE